MGSRGGQNERSLGVRHHQKTKRAFCTCGMYIEHYREGISKSFEFEVSSFYAEASY
jgi:hypothetical protein